MSEPRVVPEKPEPLQQLDRTTGEAFQAERLLVRGLRDVGVEADPKPARQRCGLAHQELAGRERRARRDRDSHHGAQPRVMESADGSLGLGQHGVGVLHDLVRREATLRGAQVHRAAAGMEPHADGSRSLDLRFEQVACSGRKDVVVVGRRRTA